MPEGQSRNGDAEPPSIWRGLRNLIFGDESGETLRERIEEVIEEHEEAQDGGGERPIAGDLAPVERQMLKNLLHFGERDAGDIGVPRADIIAVEEATPFDEVVRLFVEHGHSRMPVYRGALDTVVGMVHVKDVFASFANAEPNPPTVANMLRQPLYVPQSMGAIDLLAQMRATRTHLAIVLDEYSGTEGLITIEDLIEEITGEIEDEHDEAPVAMLVPLDGGAWEADARVELEDVAEAVDPRLGDIEEDVDTIGGLSAVLAGRVPAPGECLPHPSGWTIEVVDADARRVTRVRLHPPVAAPEDDEG